MFYSKLAAYFQNTFLLEHQWRAAFVYKSTLIANISVDNLSATTEEVENNKNGIIY